MVPANGDLTPKFTRAQMYRSLAQKFTVELMTSYLNIPPI